MKEKFIGTWKAAFFESPGPVSGRKAVSLVLKGICMGSADVIPGVSGGTIALITGIYEDLIAALRSLDRISVLFWQKLSWRSRFS